MATYSINSAGFVNDALAGKPFKTYGALKGVDFAPSYGLLHGHALRAYMHDHREIDYVIVSYYTPIAWRTKDGEWTKVADTFSVSTSSHQSALYRIPFSKYVGYHHEVHTPVQRALITSILDSPSKTFIPRSTQRRTVAVLVRDGVLLPVIDDTEGMYVLSDNVAERWR